mmetsp:Transcript_1634/g.2739  ORF Transcript_1634/g.2739 Transcript_1634/m.2739 type:complete len:98 (+) Transcript_1634:45-338(+)
MMGYLKLKLKHRYRWMEDRALLLLSKPSHKHDERTRSCCLPAYQSIFVLTGSYRSSVSSASVASDSNSSSSSVHEGKSDGDIADALIDFNLDRKRED